LCSFAWSCAKPDQTGWIAMANEKNFVVVFGQAIGEIDEEDEIRNTTFWNITEHCEEDLYYLEEIMNDLKKFEHNESVCCQL
jgi:hypothetical protein